MTIKCDILLTELHKIIVKKIRTLKNDGLSEEEVLAEILKTKTNKVSKKILKSAISYIFGTHLYKKGLRDSAIRHE